MKLTIPKDYKSHLDVKQTEQGIKLIKDFFESGLASELQLTRVTAPLFVLRGTGIIHDHDRGIFPRLDEGIAAGPDDRTLQQCPHPGVGEHDVRVTAKPDTVGTGRMDARCDLGIIPLFDDHIGAAMNRHLNASFM